MKVTDPTMAAELEAKAKRIVEKETRWIKRQNGVIGKFVLFKDFIKGRSKKNITALNEIKGIYGRAGNRIYKRYKDTYYLYKTCKNATKAKKFINNLKEE